MGLQLKPFSLGHMIIMQRCGLDVPSSNPYNDFITITFICSLGYDDFQELVNTRPFNFWSKHNLLSLGYAWLYTRKHTVLQYCVNLWSRKLARAINKNKDFSLLQEVATFKKYMELARKVPDTVEGEHSSNKQSDAPWTLNLYNTLIGELNYSRHEALHLPLTKLIWEFYKYAESQGAVEIVDIAKVEASGLINYVKD